ncbi:hypothetical protein QR680_003846 [Steinernema hermaphroditum]|uniref:3'-5' exonuclease domain-containing protein n=1 Tax=Steinernema hermaphroditum TaxID=289476 RepID=A0AA39HLS3_9BILA|nr:hypothetical protein QR680_003846 [Steinernema hermaphroditum]
MTSAPNIEKFCKEMNTILKAKNEKEEEQKVVPSKKSKKKGGHSSKLPESPKKTTVKKRLLSLFSDAEDPPAVLLEILALSGKTLFELVLATFQEWFRRKGNSEKVQGLLNTSIKIQAYELCAEKTKSILKVDLVLKYFRPFAGIFKFDREILEPHFKTFLSSFNYIAAAAFICYGDRSLIESVKDPIKNLLFPIFIITKSNASILYLFTEMANASPGLSKEFCTFLDDLFLKSKCELTTMVKGYTFPKGVDPMKPFSNFRMSFKNLIKAFKFEKTDFPNYKIQEAVDEMMYRLYTCKKNYQQFEDHARYAMTQGHELQEAFILRLLKENRVAEASKWARYNDFHKLVNLKKMPFKMLQVESGYALKKPPQLAAKWMGEPYQLEGFTIRFVKTHTVKQINEMTSILDNLEDGTVVGCDTEGVPSYVLDKSIHELSLLQVAFGKEAYVIDILKPNNNIPEFQEAWRALLNTLFYKKNFTVIGCNLAGDIDSIAQNFPFFKDMKKRGVVDIFQHLKALQKAHPKSKIKQLKCTPGLAGIVNAVFPNEPPMDKTEQMSCFPQRPLRKKQLDYAAKDAFVCVRVYERMNELAADGGEQDGSRKEGEQAHKETADVASVISDQWSLVSDQNSMVSDQ